MFQYSLKPRCTYSVYEHTLEHCFETSAYSAEKKRGQGFICIGLFPHLYPYIKNKVLLMYPTPCFQIKKKEKD